MLDAERARAVDEPVHRRAVERSGSAAAVGAREARQQLEIDPLRETAERAVADASRGLVKHARLAGAGDEAEHLRAHVVAVDRVDVERSSSRGAGSTPACLMTGDLIRPSMIAVVAGLPRS